MTELLDPRNGSKLGIRVYIEDTDAGGIVYYANYLKYSERARTELLREHGFGKASINEEFGCIFVVTKCQIKYIYPARLDDEINVFSLAIANKRTSIDFIQHIYKDEVCLAKLDVTIACIDFNGKACRIPEAVLNAIK